jgi:hypothetical protein
MAPVCLVTDRLEAGLVGDELELAAQRGLLAPPEIQAGRAADVESPVLQSVLGSDLTPLRPRLRGRRNVGYAFFEQTTFQPSSIETARTLYDVLATGSS